MIKKLNTRSIKKINQGFFKPKKDEISLLFFEKIFLIRKNNIIKYIKNIPKIENTL